MNITRQAEIKHSVDEAKFKTKISTCNPTKIKLSKDTLQKLQKLTNVK